MAGNSSRVRAIAGLVTLSLLLGAPGARAAKDSTSAAVKPPAPRPAAAAPATQPTRVGAQPAPAKATTTQPATAQPPAATAAPAPASAGTARPTTVQPATAKATPQSAPASTAARPATPTTVGAPGAPTPMNAVPSALKPVAPGVAPAAGAASKPPAPTAASRPAGPNAVPSAVKPAAKPAAAGAASRPGSVPTVAAGKPIAPAASKTAASPAAHVDEHITYHYNALGRRDPFQSLVEGEYVGVEVGGDAPPDVGGIDVVGIVWGDRDKFALVEDARGNGFVLRQGDKVMNGFVESLKRDALIVSLTVDGQTESVTIPLTRKGDKSNATR